MIFLKSYKLFEAMGTLSKDDTDIIEDLCLSFSEDWNLSFEIHGQLGISGKYGYISIQRFDKFFIQFSVQTNQLFELEMGDSRKMIEEDLNKVINRIEKFGYNVQKVNSGTEINGSFGGYVTYTFTISHTD